MSMTRREMMVLTAGSVAAFGLTGMPAQASVDDAIAAFTGGADVGEGGITLTTPEIAENGNTVPIEVDAPGAVSILILAAGNPLPGVATFNFGPLSGARAGSTRIRLARSQDVVAVAKMEDGTFVKASNPVKVTIGGCGG